MSSTSRRHSATTPSQRIAAGAIVLAAWYTVTAVAGSYSIPGPMAVVSRAVAELTAGALAQHVTYTMAEASLGFLLGAPSAVALAFALGRHPAMVAALAPVMSAGFGLPKLALTPLLIVWFGVGMTSKVALVALSTFFILYFNTLAGIRTGDPRLIAAVRVLGATDRDVLLRVIVPTALPNILAGLRIAVPYSIGGAIVGELVSANRGLGYFLQFSANDFDPPGVFVALLAAFILVAIANLGLGACERRFLRWRSASVDGPALTW